MQPILMTIGFSLLCFGVALGVSEVSAWVNQSVMEQEERHVGSSCRRHETRGIWEPDRKRRGE
jgi:hypothetical protein